MSKLSINSGLGDYIHLHYENYLRQGTYRPSALTGKTGAKQTSSISSESALQQVYRELKQQIAAIKTTAKTSILEKYLTSFYRLPTLNREVTQVYGLSVSNQEMEQNLTQAISSQLPDVSYNRALLQAESFNLSGSNLDTAKYKYSNINRAKKISYQSIQKIENRLRKILANMQKLLWSNNLSQSAIDSLLRNQSEISSMYQALQRYTNNFAKKSFEIKNSDGTLNEIGSLIKQINNIRADYGRVLQEDTAVVSEMATAAALLNIAKKGAVGVNDIINSTIGKNSRSSNIEIYSNVYGKDFLQKNNRFNRTVLLDSGNPEVKKQAIITTPTQDTVDISINVEDNQSIFGTDIFTASIKSSADIATHSLKIVEGVTLNTVLNLIGIDFGNHYLNLLVQDNGKGQIRKPGGAADAYTQMVKYALAVRGFTGLRQQGFNKLNKFLIVYDRASLKVHVLSTYQILSRLTPIRIDEYVHINGLPKQGEISNDEKGSARERISNILTEAKKYKLTLSLRPNALKRI